MQSVEAFWRAVNLAVLPGSGQEAQAVHDTTLPGTGATEHHTGATEHPQDLNATQGPGHPPLPPVQDFHPAPSFSQDHRGERVSLIFIQLDEKRHRRP